MTSIAFTGDISFSKYMTDSWKKEDLLDEQVKGFLHSADHVVANVECTLSTTPTTAGGLKHSSDPRAGGYVRDVVGSKIWSLANNHILDSKAPGLLDTLEVAKEYGCQTIGAGVNKDAAAKPVYLDAEGGIGIFSVVYDISTLRTPENEPGVLIWNETERIQKTIDEIKAKCRWCVMVVHGQRCEFTSMALPAARQRMISFLDMGADVIVGHHPHVVQNYEVFGEKIIFYSLGNFVFDTDYQRLQRYTDQGIFVKLAFDKDSFTWDHRAMKIDRTGQCIVPCETPAIFTGIPASQYRLLWPLAMHDLYENERVKFGYLFPKMKGISKKKWAAFYRERGKKYPRWQCIARGDRLYRLGLWRLGDKKVRSYITDGMRK